MTASLLIYGATGYTGQLITQNAVAEGLQPIVAGRNAKKVGALAGELGLEGRVFSLDDTAALPGNLAGISCLLNVAGPFSRTALPLIDACLETGTHYLDVTGEIDVFVLAASRDAAAREAGIMLMPGVGMVSSDCLAAMVAGELAEPVLLEIGVLDLGGASQGTKKTVVESAGAPTRMRREGKIVSRPPGSVKRTFDFGRGAREMVAVSLGDVATAYYSTGVPNITAYFPARRARATLRLMRWLGPVLQMQPVQALIKRVIERGPAGPDDEMLETAISILVAEVADRDGQKARARLETPNGYKLTYLAAVDMARRVLGGEWQAGFRTPSLAFGPRYVLGLPGCRLEMGKG